MGATGDRLPADGWQQERADVLTELALLAQAVRGMRDDLGDWRTQSAETLRELREQDKARQDELNRLLQTCSERGVQLQSTRLKMDELQGRVKVVEGGMPAVKVIMWVGAALGVSMVGLIWALITGQAQVVFR